MPALEVIGEHVANGLEAAADRSFNRHIVSSGYQHKCSRDAVEPTSAVATHVPAPGAANVSKHRLLRLRREADRGNFPEWTKHFPRRGRAARLLSGNRLARALHH